MDTSWEEPEPTTLALAAGINDEQVAASAPMVRALVVQRLEMMWRACEPRINLTQADVLAGRTVDPRFLESGIRITDRLVNLYQLTRPQHQMSEPDTATRVDQRELAKARISELETKVRDSGYQESR